MTVLRLDVELPYPVELVWQALTDRRLLGQWFLQTDFMPVAGGVYHAFPGTDLPGFTAPFDVDVVEVVGPTRLVLRWRGEQLHADVVWELSTVAGGSRLRVSQTGFFGIGGQVRRAELQRAYATMFEQRLPALLARQEQAASPPAAGAARTSTTPPTCRAAPGHGGRPRRTSPPRRTPDSRRAASLSRRIRPTSPGGHRPGKPLHGDPRAAYATRGGQRPGRRGSRFTDPVRGGRARRRGRPCRAGFRGLLRRVSRMPVDRRLRLLSAAGAMVLTVLAVTAVATLVLRAPGPGADPLGGGRSPWSGLQAGESKSLAPTADPAGSASPAASPSGTVVVTPQASPSAAVSPPDSPGATEVGGVAAAVSYRTLETWSGGYIGEITIRPATAVDGWSAVILLPAKAQVTSAWDRIDFRQTGVRVTFTPQAAHRELPAGADFVFAFQVGDPSGATRPKSCKFESVSCAQL
ncbi:SRPBCC domain-containing protein [Catellatospora coxensis]